MSGPRVLLIEHERASPGGLVAEWLATRDAEIETLPIDQGAEPGPPDSYDLIVSLGSEFSAYDESRSWVTRELELFYAALAQDVPVLGICFGGQLLARALGSEVFQAGESEIGWVSVETSVPDLVSPSPWFQWHFDTFSPPASAELLASNHVGPQAFRYGRSLGVQFHPEVDLEIMESWVKVYAHELDEHGVDAAELLEQTRLVAAGAKAATERLLEGFCSDVARLDDPSGRVG